MAKRGQSLDIGHGRGGERTKRHFGIDPQFGRPGGNGHFRGRELAKLLAKRGQLRLLDFQARRRRMAAMGQ